MSDANLDSSLRRHSLSFVGVVLLILSSPVWGRSHWLGMLFARGLLIPLALFLATAMFYRYAVKERHRLEGKRRNLALTVYALVVMFLGLELVFTFIPRSHGVGYTIANRTWLTFYWTGRTQLLELRKPDQAQSTNANKKRVVVVGDSFAAGRGVKDVRDLFSSQLAALLPADYTVDRLAQSGADTEEESGFLATYPFKPHAVVLQYYGNDIEGAAKRAGLAFDGLDWYSDVNLVKVVVTSSFVLNYVYWLRPGSETNGYVSFLQGAYRDHDAWSLHRADLDKFVTFCRSRNVPLVAVIFPFLTDIEGSTFYTSAIEGFFAQRQVPVLNVSQLVTSLPVRERIVNNNDAHPSVTVHHMIGQKLFRLLRERGFVR